LSKKSRKLLVKSETRGKVHVLKLIKKQEYQPKRKLSVRRGLKRLRAFFPCQAPEMTAEHLVDLVLKTFGSDYEYHLLISDEKFRVITKPQMEQLLKEDDTDTLPYIATYADCDDFSDVLIGVLTKKTWVQGFAIGQLWFYTPTYGHAIDVFCDGVKIYLVEPQNDEISEWPADYKDKGWRAFMVKF